MELLNHFVAARLMKDAQLFERIGRHGVSRPHRGSRAVPNDAGVDERQHVAGPRARSNAGLANDDGRSCDLEHRRVVDTGGLNV